MLPFALIAAIAMGFGAAIIPLEWTLAALAFITLIIAYSMSPLAALAVMLILAPLRTLIATESPLQLPLDIGQIAFVLFIGVWIAHQIALRRPLLSTNNALTPQHHLHQWTPVYIPLLVFIIATGLTIFTAASIGAWLTEWLKWLIMLVMIALVMHLGRGQRWQWIIFALVMAALANALVGFYIFFGGSGADHLVILGQFFRAFGTFGQPNPFGGFLGLIAPLALMMIYAHSINLYRIWQSQRHIAINHALIIAIYGVCFAVIAGGIIISWSRGAWLSFVVSMGAIAFALPRKTSHSLLLAFISMGLVLGVWFSGILPDSIVARIASSTEEFFAFDDVRGVDITSANYAVVERLAHWQAALNMAQANPFLGVGLGNYEVVYDDYRLINWDEALGHAHNYYLNILGEAGIIGFSAYLTLWLSVAWLTWQARRHPDARARAACIGLFGTWVYLSAHSFLDNLYVNNVFLHLGALLGVLAVLFHQATSSFQSSPSFRASPSFRSSSSSIVHQSYGNASQ